VKKFKEKRRKGKLGTGFARGACQKKPLMPESGAMNPSAVTLAMFVLTALFGSISSAQTLAPTPVKPSADAAQLEALAKKIDEQNAKIDMLSQQILKLQQQLASTRPGVMIGEGAPTTSTTTPAPAEPSTKPANGSTHIVARGETLTSIAKMHGVSVSDLQKYNHIDNPLKLQAGQTILIPASPTPAPSGSSSGE
jgi:LysM repeat protein